MLLFCLFLGGFVLGVLAILGLEAAGVLYVLNRLSKKASRADFAAKGACRELDPQQSLDSAYNKQGIVWVLEPDKVPKNRLAEKVPKEQKRKRDFLEVSPVQKCAKVNDKKLILKNPDGSKTTTIELKGCVIEAVSASSLPSRKWAKKFPLKIESKTSLIYNGSKIVYLYLETSWEKESWCKALRLASCDDKEKLRWVAKLNEEFRSYIGALITGYPSFMKSSIGYSPELMDKGNRVDGSSSKVRSFWKKLSRKTSGKSSSENKGAWNYPTVLEEKKISEKLRSSQESVTSKVSSSSAEENTTLPPSAACSRSVSQNYASVASDAESEDRFGSDEGTLCMNLLISRLFFDAKGNTGLNTAMQSRIQRTLSNTRTPSYVGEIICTGTDIGSLPPYIHGMRLLPIDMNEVWAFEVDVEYSGGAILDVETRLEVCEPDLQNGISDANIESNSAENVSSELLEGFEDLGKQLNLSEGNHDEQEQKNGVEPKADGVKSNKGTMPSTSSASRWKSILNSVAKQVSQVPISLSIRVASLRGTMRLHLKPPPSDQLWFGFTSMPDVEFGLESSVGDHKIASGHIAVYLINRFKAAIRETMVLPNCESVCLPWMLAEKDDWVPRNVAPFIWVNQEAVGDHNNISEAFSSPNAEPKSKETNKEIRSNIPDGRRQNPRKVESFKHNLSEAVSSCAIAPSIRGSKSLHELTDPLLPHEASYKRDEEIIPKSSSSSPSPSPSRSFGMPLSKQNSMSEDEDSRQKKGGRRARMLDLGKKMGEKFEEKRRQVEEKSRLIVDKMRERA